MGCLIRKKELDAVCLIDGKEVRLLDLPLNWSCPAVTIYAEEE